jgi:hypothetical protein
MSTLSVTNINTANGTTDLSIKTGNTSGPVLVVGAGSNVSITNTTNLLLGSNVNITTSSIIIGNSTVNVSVNTSTIFVGNSTVNAVINTSSISIPTLLFVGNSTVNSSVNNSTIFIGNSTVNTIITPTTVRVGNNTTGFFVTTTGNVGISNTAPTLNFYVNGSSAGAIGTLADAANISINFGSFNNYSVTLNGNRNIDNPTGLQPGQSGVIYLSQNSTGGQAPTWSSFWKFPGNTAPTLTTTASAVDAVVYVVRNSTSITAQAILNVG